MNYFFKVILIIHFLLIANCDRLEPCSNGSSLIGLVSAEQYSNPLPLKFDNLRTSGGLILDGLDRALLENPFEEYPISSRFDGEVKEDCSVTSYISGCSDSPDNPVFYKKSDTVVLRATFKPTSRTYCNNLAGVSFEWKLSGLNVLSTKIPGGSVLELPGTPLDYGNYTVELTSRALASPSLGLVKMDFRSTSKCWFGLKPVAPIAGIRGGSLRTEEVGEYLIFDGSPSYDPNSPDDSLLSYHWSCDVKLLSWCTGRTTKEPIFTAERSLKPNKMTLRLKVTVEGLDENLYPSNEFVQVINIIKGKVSHLFEIVCCGSHEKCLQLTRSDVPCLRLLQLPPAPSEISWSYWKDSGSESPVDGIQQAGSQEPGQLLLRRDSLEAGVLYHFKAVYEDGVSIYDLRLEEGVRSGRCEARSQEGADSGGGPSQYTVECTGFAPVNPAAGHLLYQLYEKQAPESPVLLFSSHDAKMVNLILKTGDLTVRVINAFGGFTEAKLSVSLRDDTTVDEKNVEELIKKFAIHIWEEDLPQAAGILGILAKGISSLKDKEEISYKILHNLLKVKLHRLPEALLSAGMLRVLMYQAEGNPSLLTSSSVRLVGDNLARIVRKLHEYRTELYQFHLEDTLQVSRLLLCSADPVLLSRDPIFLDNEAFLYDRESSYFNYLHASQDIVTGIETIGNIVLGVMLEAQEELKIDSNNLIMSTKVAKGGILSKEGEMDPSGEGLAKLVLDNNFGLAYSNDILEIQVTEFKKGLFWWQTDFPANSRNLNVLLRRRKAEITIPIDKLKSDIHLAFKPVETKPEVIRGSVTLPKSSGTALDKNKAVSIHKIDRPKDGSGMLALQFKDLGSSQLHVVLLVNKIPSFTQVQSGGVVNSTNPSFLSPVYMKESEDDLLYIGIVPSSEHKEGDVVKYSFEIQDQVCRVWRFDQWNTADCRVGKDTVMGEVHCLCGHLSVFGGSFFVPPNYVNPLRDIHLFRNIQDNPYILFLVSALLLIYLILFIYAFTLDKRDRASRGVHLLPDNFPGDNYGYVIVVFTGNRFNAGTTSKVGVMLSGKLSHSRKHILNHREHLLQGGQDNWFLIFSPHFLGEITSIALWHDNSGPHPDWYCSKIMVYDLSGRRQYMFFVDKWLSVAPLLGGRTERVLDHSSLSSRVSLKTLTKENIVTSFREAHVYLSIFLRHPRSDVSRTQKLTVRLLVITVSILTTLMFYGAAKAQREDMPEVALKLRDLFILLEVFAIMVAVNFISNLFFGWAKKSVRNKRKGEKSDEEKGTISTNVPKKESTLSNENKILQVNEEEETEETIVKEHFSRTQRIKKMIVSKIKNKFVLPPLEPVFIAAKEPELPPLTKKQLFYLAIAWSVHLVLIILVIFFILLYGLRFGPNKTVIIMSIVTVNILKSLIFTQTLVMLIFSAGASFFRVPRKQTITFEIDPKGVKLERTSEPGYQEKLLRLRAQRMYHPMSELDILIARERLSQSIWKIIVLVFVILIYLSFIIIAAGIQIEPAYFHTKHIRSILSSETKKDFSVNPIANNKDSFTTYLLSSLLPSLHNGIPNSSPTNESKEDFEDGWVSDNRNKVLGVPRLRQIRITNGTCEVPDLMSAWFKTCDGPLTFWNLETKIFGFGWRELQANQRVPPGWNYSTPRSSESLLMFGRSGLPYPGGGYLQELGEDLRQSQMTVAKGHFFGWTDNRRTRALILEFNLYCAHGSTLTQVSLMAEYLPSGVWITRASIESVFFPFSATNDLMIISVIVLLIIILILIGIQASIQISAIGIIDYFKNFSRLCDFLIIFFGFGTILTGLVTAQYFKNYSEKFVDPVADTFISCMYPFYENYLHKLFFGAFIIVITVRLLTRVEYGANFHFIKRTLKDSMPYILWVMILSTAALILLSVLMYLTRKQHSDIIPVLPYPRRQFVNFIDNAKLQNESIFFYILVNYIHLFVQVLFIVFFVYFYGRAKFEMSLKGESFRRENIFKTLVKYISKGLSSLFRNNDKVMRLRGGTGSNETAEICKEIPGETLDDWTIRRTKLHERTIQRLDIILDLLDQGKLDHLNSKCSCNSTVKS